jgi:hypothetical protein
MATTLVKAAGPATVTAPISRTVTLPGADRFTSSMTFRIWSSSLCSASLTVCRENWPLSSTRPPAMRHRPATPSASGSSPGRPPGLRRARTITNCVTNRGGDGADTPAGVRDRVARANYPSLQDLLARVDDETIATAIRACGTWGDAGWRYRLAASSSWSGRWHVISSPG